MNAGHFGSGDMEDGVTLDVPSFSSVSLLFTSLLLEISGPVQMVSARVFTTCRDMSSGGGGSLCAGSAERLPSVVLICCWTYGFIPLCTSKGYLVVDIPFTSCTGLCSPGVCT